jgi:hypothetical protein
MDQNIECKLEAELEEAIAETMSMFGPKHMPFRPAKKNNHLMAKAAVIARETAAENRRDR